MKKSIFWTAAAVVTILLFFADLLTGSTGISPGTVWNALTGGDVPDRIRTIILEIRLPKAATAALAGTAVSVSGLLMQTIFRNPLAGPYVLGVSSGASLGAALYVMGSSALMFPARSVMTYLGLAGAAWAGAAAVLAIILFSGRRFPDILVILILGMMISSAIDAFVQILQYMSDETSLKSYIIWTMGSLGNVSGTKLAILGTAVAAGLAISLACVKPLNLLLFGETYAETMGLDTVRTRRVIFFATVMLAGTVTAFCGPLGFLGLAVPHVTRMVAGDSDHRKIIPGCIFCGASLMLVCDIISKSAALPVNAITSLLGIPVVITVILKNGKISFANK